MFYIDSSAIVKLIVSEYESAHLQLWIADKSGLLLGSSWIAWTEVNLAVSKTSPNLLGRAKQVLDTIVPLSFDLDLARMAGTLGGLRSLDALHLMTALNLGNACQGIITYDTRMAEAAHQHDCKVISPGH